MKLFTKPLFRLHLSAGLFFMLIAWFSFSNLEYRFLHDGSLALFEIANYKRLFIPLQRLASVFNQFIPLLLTHTHASLYTVALGFHFNDILWYVLAYMVLYLLKEWKYIPVLLIGYFATAGDNFFMISFEALLAWPLVVIFYALALRDNLRQSRPVTYTAVLLVLAIPVIWCHPLLTFAFMVAGIHLVLVKKIDVKGRPVAAVIAGVFLMIVIRLLILPDYDRDLMVPMQAYGVESLHLSFLQTCVYRVKLILMRHPLGVLLILIAGVTVGINQRRHWLYIAFISMLGFCFLAFLFFYSFSVTKIIFPFVYISLLMLAFDSFTIPFLTKKPVKMVAALFLVVAAGIECMNYLQYAGDRQQKTAMITEALAEVPSYGKAYLVMEDIPPAREQLKYAMNLESMVITGLQPPYKTRALAVITKPEVLMIDTISPASWYPGNYMAEPVSGLDTCYFKLDTLPYIRITME